VLNLTKATGRQSEDFDRLTGQPRIRLADDIVSNSHDWLTQSSSVSKAVVDEDDIELLSLSFVLSSAKVSLHSGLPTVLRNFDDEFKSNLSCLTLLEFSVSSWHVFQTDISAEMEASSTDWHGSRCPSTSSLATWFVKCWRCVAGKRGECLRSDHVPNSDGTAAWGRQFHWRMVIGANWMTNENDQNKEILEGGEQHTCTCLLSLEEPPVWSCGTNASFARWKVVPIHLAMKPKDCHGHTKFADLTVCWFQSEWDLRLMQMPTANFCRQMVRHIVGRSKEFCHVGQSNGGWCAAGETVAGCSKSWQRCQKPDPGCCASEDVVFVWVKIGWGSHESNVAGHCSWDDLTRQIQDLHCGQKSPEGFCRSLSNLGIDPHLHSQMSKEIFELRPFHKFSHKSKEHHWKSLFGALPPVPNGLPKLKQECQGWLANLPPVHSRGHG